MSGRRRRLTAAVVAVLATTGVAGCGTQSAPGGWAGATDEDQVTATAPDEAVVTTEPPAAARALVDLDQDVATGGTLFQEGKGAPVKLCGTVLTSYPPQCGGGTRIEGDVDWAALHADAQGDLRWVDQVFAVGRYDPATDTLRLSRPLMTQPPAGWHYPQEDPPRGTACPDPTADLGTSDGAAASAGQAGLGRLGELLQPEGPGAASAVPGFVGWWVSDGESVVNVRVTSGGEAARAQVRTVYRGPLCVVETPGAPTRAAQTTAQEHLSDQAQQLGLRSVGAGTDRLHVMLVVADAAHVDALLRAVSPWLTPDQVSITSEMVNLDTLQGG